MKIVRSSLPACFIVLVALLAGCATAFNASPKPPENATVQEDPAAAIEASSEEESKPSEPKPEVYLGNDTLIKLPAAAQPIAVEGEDVLVNFEATPLEDVVHGIMGDILGLDYVVEGKIPGNVTLRSQSPIARKELLVVLESMLEANGATMVRGAQGRYIVTASKTFKTRTPRYERPGSKGVGFSNVIVPLEYIGATQMADILKPVAPNEAFIRIDSVRNLLILGGTSTQLSGWLDIVDTFDVDHLKGMSVAIYPIEYTPVAEVNAALETLLSTAGEGGSPLTGLLRVVPLESLGSIMVVTPRKQLLEQVEQWIERLDKMPMQSAEPQLFVYSVQNGTAEYLAELLSSIFGGGSVGGGDSRQTNQEVAPGLTPSNLSSGSQKKSNKKKNSGGSSSSFTLGDSAKVVADSVNNSLVVYATSREYRKIESALKQLDVMPSQILIEASILEITLNDELSYGLEWYFENTLGGGWSGDGYVGLGTNSKTSAPAFGYAFSNPMDQIQALLQAESTKELVKVLSTPSIMVLDNHSAAIHVGTQQPIRTSSTLLEGGGVSNSISYRDTGVKLDVTPSVNAGGLVTMDLLQSVTDIGSIDSATGQASFYERNIESRVAVRSGESVVLGGLISDNQTKGKTGLPFFQDLPIIGSLFGRNTSRERRTELLVIITPYVLKSDRDLQDVTSEMRKRMKGLKVFEDISADKNNGN